MISISHWGMFELSPRIVAPPKGYKFAPHDPAEWLRPDGIIPIERDDPSR